jgi:hypothetical protein
MTVAHGVVKVLDGALLDAPQHGDDRSRFGTIADRLVERRSGVTAP